MLGERLVAAGGSGFQYSCDEQVERRRGVSLAVDQRFDAGPVGGGAERRGERRVADSIGGEGSECGEPRGEVSAELRVAASCAYELEEQKREVAVERHRLGRWLLGRLLGLLYPGRELVVQELHEQALLGSEMVVQGALRAAGVLAHTIQRGRVIPVSCERATRRSEQASSGLGASLGLRSPSHFYTIKYISTIEYGSLAMARDGLTIESPKIGQQITFIRTAQDTDGAELVIEARMRRGAFMPPHRHLRQEETFDVLEGTGTFKVAGRRVVARAGERVKVPAGVSHRFRNRSDGDVRIRATLRPALRTEELFERLFALGAQGKVNKLGAPNPIITASLIREFREEFFYLGGVPVAVQRILAGARP